MRKRLLPPGFERSPQVRALPLIEEPALVIRELVRLYPDYSARLGLANKGQASKERLKFGFNEFVSETATGRMESLGLVDVTRYESLEQAENAFLIKVASLAIQFTPGTLSGKPIGEGSAYNVMPNIESAIYFLRRNVVGMVIYHRPVEVIIGPDPRRPKRGGAIPDPNINDKCETLARRIDDAVAMHR